MAKYIFKYNYTVISADSSCGTKNFRKGEIYDLVEKRTPEGELIDLLFIRGGLNQNKCYYSIKNFSAVRKIKDKFQEDVSYLGQEQLEKQNDNVKTLLIVVSLVAVAIVVYLLAKGKLFNSLKS